MAVDVRSLYSVAPGEFVAARTALVKALKAEQRKEEAAAIQQLRRPRLAEHALNLAAHTEPDVVARWAAAVAQLDAAQSTAIGGGGASALREAAADLRDAHAAVLKAAVVALGGSGTAQQADINDTLRSLAHPDGVPLLTAGIVGSEQLGEFALFAGAPEPVVQRDRSAAQPKPTRASTPATPDETPAPALSPTIDLKQLRALERAAAAARKESDAADVALTAAREALAAAKDAVAAATERAATARGALREAEQAVDALRNPAAD